MNKLWALRFLLQLDKTAKVKVKRLRSKWVVNTNNAQKARPADNL